MQAVEGPPEASERQEAGRFLSRRKLIALGGTALAGGLIAMVTGSVWGSAPEASSSAKASQAVMAVPQTGSVRVKAVYFQMVEAMPVDHEYVVLEAPAKVGDLMEALASGHPQFAAMKQGMSILVDGQVATYATPLNAGDEVDFIPMLQGG